MKNILFVTSFKDINRDKYNIFTSRTVDTYVSYFLNIALHIKYPIVVFVEENVKNILLKHKLSKHVIVEDINKVDTFLSKYLEADTRVMNSKKFKRKIPFFRKFLPETQHSKYNLVNHNKINFVRYAKGMFPSYDFYSWIDFGMIRSDIIVPPEKLLLDQFPTTKIIVQSIKEIPETPISKKDMLSTNDVYIAGSTWIIPNELVDTYETLYETKLKEFYKEYVSDDDQSVMIQVYFDNPTMFQVYNNKHWFTLFYLVPNNSSHKYKAHWSSIRMFIAKNFTIIIIFISLIILVSFYCLLRKR